jgi:hypothetical protein
MEAEAATLVKNLPRATLVLQEAEQEGRSHRRRQVSGWQQEIPAHLRAGGDRGEGALPEGYDTMSWSACCSRSCAEELREAVWRDVPVVWTSLGPLPRWVPGPTTRWAPGTTRLVPHGTCWHEAQGPRWRSTRIGSYTYHVLCRGLLNVHD